MVVCAEDFHTPPNEPNCYRCRSALSRSTSSLEKALTVTRWTGTVSHSLRYDCDVVKASTLCIVDHASTHAHTHTHSLTHTHRVERAAQLPLRADCPRPRRSAACPGGWCQPAFRPCRGNSSVRPHSEPTLLSCLTFGPIWLALKALTPPRKLPRFRSSHVRVVRGRLAVGDTLVVSPGLWAATVAGVARTTGGAWSEADGAEAGQFISLVMPGLGVNVGLCRVIILGQKEVGRKKGGCVWWETS